MKFILIALLFSVISICPALLADFTSKDLVMVPHNVLPNVELTLDMHVQKNGTPKGAYSGTADEDLTVKIKDFVTFSFGASEEGYVSLWNIGSSKKVTRLFPNSFHHDMKVVAGKTYQLGGKDQPFGFRAEGPEGMEDVFLLWTAQESDQPVKINDDSLNELGVYDIEQILEVAKVKTDRWASQHLAFDVSENGRPLEEDYRVMLEKAAKKLTMNGVKGNVYLLSMGANTKGLSKAGADAINFSRAIKQLFGGKVRQKLYSEARVKDFRKGMKWLQKKVGKNDLAIIYFSGHGSTYPDKNGDEKDQLDEVFVMTDANSTRAPSLKHVIVDDEFARGINALRTNNLVVVLDACYSAGLTKSATRVLQGRQKFLKGGALGKRFSGLLADWFSGGADFKKGVLVYAAEESQAAYEGAKGGVMTNQLLREMLNSRNKGQNWYTLIRNAGLKVGRRVGVRPAMKGNIGLLKRIRLSK